MNICIDSLYLALIPDALRGRVISACRLFPKTTRPIGLALTGVLLQRIGVMPTVLAFWVCLLDLTVVATLDPNIRKARKSV